MHSLVSDDTLILLWKIIENCVMRKRVVATFVVNSPCIASVRHNVIYDVDVSLSAGVYR